MSLTIIADHKIPFVAEFFGAHGEVILLPKERITQKTLQKADLLLTRTVTSVSADLLAHTAVKWVGSATTGIDHVDIPWLAQQSIAFADAAGANTTAVVEYVFCCMAALKKMGCLKNKDVMAGVIGCGRIGTRVAHLFQMLGFTVQCHDPLLIENKPPFNFASLDTLIHTSDVISIHTPLTTIGNYPTFHMINALQLHNMKNKAVLINTARGSVIDQTALTLINGKTLCFDVWENEPDISLTSLNQITLGTPHIAGYSLNAKYQTTKILYKKAATFFEWQDRKLTAVENVKNRMIINPSVKHASEIALSIYDPLKHTQKFRSALLSGSRKKNTGDIFNRERKNYVLRAGFLENV